MDSAKLMQSEGSRRKKRTRSSSSSSDCSEQGSHSSRRAKPVQIGKKKSKKSKKSKTRKRGKNNLSDTDSSSSSSESSDTSTSSSSEDSSAKRRKRKKLKKLKKKLKKQKMERRKMLELAESQKVACRDKKILQTDDKEDLIGPGLSLLQSKARAPMTKEEWEKKQGQIKRVLDPETGRHRLIRGDGEIIEEIVSRDRHVEINQTATRSDGNYFALQAMAKAKLQGKF